ncbi:hypothetical protein AO501_12375 [Mycobacterium gordonae]|uniref:Uncharacterized protein n=1 Tax=Mycobacterium gordonae TaxID=1778 RepID=A0A0Q2QV10_MYCGO|nr:MULTISPECIES: hypothetical protein [Mycobacterium]KQH75838.1 hypothetical protein AO501_12375 [Mycobacterium gordonae]MDP7732573.1 hypothetical protein [Mycobacterium sp. TY813]
MSINDNAHEFGQHFKQGGWRLGFLVARSVEHGGSGGRPSENRSLENGSGKVSISRFAELAGVSKSHVSYYFKAWQLAADDKLCPSAEQLSPDSDDGLRDDIDEDDNHTREMWLKYLQQAREPREPGTRGAKAGSRSKATTGDTAEKDSQAVEALTDISDKLAKNLVKVFNGVGPKLMGDEAGLAAYVEKLRHTRFELDKQCREIDQLLERIGFGDQSPADDRVELEENGIDQ